MTIISENDWKCFCEEWGGIETKGLSATIDNINDSENVLTGSSEEMQICEDQLGTGDKVNNENGTGQFLIKTCPEVIQDSALFCWLCYVAGPILLLLHFSFLKVRTYFLQHYIHLHISDRKSNMVFLGSSYQLRNYMFMLIFSIILEISVLGFPSFPLLPLSCRCIVQ